MTLLGVLVLVGPFILGLIAGIIVFKLLLNKLQKAGNRYAIGISAITGIFGFLVVAAGILSIIIMNLRIER